MCRATMDDIMDTLKELLAKPPLGETSPATTFAVSCEVRSCSSLSKKDLIDKVAAMVQPKHKVQLYLPDTMIVVQVLKSACGVSVVPNAARYCKSQKSSFNLLQHAATLMQTATAELASATTATQAADTPSQADETSKEEDARGQGGV
mmetsp:Transcript_4357/g.8852  ORF Transcript_4357/g.8852 Transcript_4357/m.8852 type:complete len:148 (+) Transcript_4357:265-708(+)